MRYTLVRKFSGNREENNFLDGNFAGVGRSILVASARFEMGPQRGCRGGIRVSQVRMRYA